VRRRRPSGCRRWEVSTPNGTTLGRARPRDLAHVVWGVNQGCLGFHAWPNRFDSQEGADELRIDLDPTPDVTLEMVREAAREARVLLGELGLEGFRRRPDVAASTSTCASRRASTPTPSGPPPWRSPASWSAAGPDLVTAAWWKEERGAAVFVDFNQNAPHKTVFAAWGARPRPGGQVSTPFHWDELDEIDPDVLTIASVPARVESDGDPWATIDERPYSLAPLLELGA
jgi:DNA primase